MKNKETIRQYESHESQGELADPGEVLMRYLRRHGLRQTSRRKLILEVFLNMAGHPSSEEIRDAVLCRDRTVGMATIYRALKLFLESGIARKQRFGDGLDRYEPNYGKREHMHLICELCGRTLELSMRIIDTMYKELAKTHGFVLHRHQTCLYGVCKECARTLRFGNEVKSGVRETRGELGL